MSGTCRSCGGSGLEKFLSLGSTPLANSLLRFDQLDQPEPRFPLDVAFCAQCGLVQIVETVPPRQLFSEYFYFSSVSTTMVEAMRRLADRLIFERNLDSQSLVVEIASNDGYLLQWYAQRAIPVLGIEPAQNIARVANERGIRTEAVFFNSAESRRLAQLGRADVIHANNVLAHVPDLNDVMDGVSTLLKPEGIAVIEVPYVRDLVERVEFDTIYHEHVFYFALTPLVALLARHALRLIDVERIPIHGGSLRLFIGHEQASSSARAGVADLLAMERRDGIVDASYYRGFSGRVAALRNTLRQMLLELKQSGKRIAAYGASAKGSTLLNTCGLGDAVLDFVVDRSIHKQGLFMPGVHIPVIDPEALVTRMPDYVLLLTWNFADEILVQQKLFRDQGGKFIVPIPEPKIL